MDIELLIQHGEMLFQPLVEDGITWTTERKGTPGVLKFAVLKDEAIDFTEGDPVRLRVDGKKVFYGFVFTKKRGKDGKIQVTAYDQLRYFKNKDTYVFEGVTASEIVRRIAADFRLQVGTLTETRYRIPSLVESDSTLFDIVQNALDLELRQTGELYVLYDDFGSLTLRRMEELALDLLIDAGSAADFSYQSSIDSNTYNQLKLTRNNEDTGYRDVWMARSSDSINQWGLLQYTEELQNGEDGADKANALLRLYGQKSRTLSVSDAFGDARCRAGSLVAVRMDLGDLVTSNYMLVEKATHTIRQGAYTMNLTLRGGMIHG